MIQVTLCFVFQGEPRHSLLLGYKKRGFAQGKVGGFGGKIQAGESLPQAAARELFEEAGITADPAELESLGVLTFIFPARPAWDQEVHVFVARRWQGTPSESDEMRPRWYPLSALPLEHMWDDTPTWMPHILAGEYITARFTMNPDNETVGESWLQVRQGSGA